MHNVGRACYVHCIPPSLEYVSQMFAEVRAGARSGSHPGPGVSFMPWRNAAQVIHADLGLDFAATVGP